MKLILLVLSLTACAVHNHVLCAGDSIPMTYELKAGDTIDFPDHCAYDWQGGSVQTAGGGGPVLVR